MSDITILAARRPVANQLQAILRDWASLGLVTRVVVADLDSAREADDLQPVLVLEGSDTSLHLLQDVLTQGVIEVARVCVVSVVDDDENVVSMAQCSWLRSLVLAALPTSRCVQAHVIAGSPVDDWGSKAVAMMGWHTFALSPEDAASPRQGAAPLTRDPEDPRWLTHLVGSLCSLLGLWRGQRGSILDDRQAPPGEVVVPLRVFSRLMTAEAVEQAVDRRLLTFGHRYPVPRVDTTSAVVVDDESAAVVGMADALLQKHRDILPRERKAQPPVAKAKVGVLKALRDFCTFMLNALRHAPRQLAERLLYEAAKGSAEIIERAILGVSTDSSFAVVVRGVRADGSLASWGEFEAGLDSVVQRGNQGGDLLPPPQKPQFWHDMIDGGMTLLDAGTRCAELPPRTLGAQRAVVATTDRVAPRQEDRFRLQPNLAAFFPDWEVEVGDDIAAGRLFDQLESLSRSTPHLAADLSAEKQRLREWSANTTNSYVGRIGRRLGDAFRVTVAEVQQLNDLLTQLLAENGLPDSVAQTQDALAKRLRWFSVFALIAALSVVALMVVHVVAIMAGVIAVLCVMIGWAIGGSLMYMQGQRSLYALIHRRKAAASRLETAELHRQQALEDLRRLSRTYRQFLDWARAFASFVHAPLGRPSLEDDVPLYIGQGLPRSIRVGVAVPDNDAVDEVSNRWRDRLFPAGWLSACWQEFIADVPSSLGQLRYLVQSDGDILFQDPNPDGEGPIATRWSRAVAEAAPGRNASEAFLDRVRALTLADEGARSRLLQTVVIRDASSGDLIRQARTDFVEGLDRDYAGEPLTFAAGMFSPHATNIDVRAVRESVLRQDFKGLALANVLIQLGGANPVSEFRSKIDSEHSTATAGEPTSRRAGPSFV